MGSHRQTLLHDLPTVVAVLRGETRVHSDHLMTSSCSLFFKNVEECAPTGVHDAFCQGMILDHVENTQLLNSDHLVLFGIVFGCLILKVSALTGDLEMGVCRATGSLTAAFTALLAAAHHALLASQGLLRAAIEAWVLNGMALAIGEKGLQSYVNANSRMSTVSWSMFERWVSLTDQQRVPVPIGTMNEVDCLGSAFNGTMHLDLEQFSQFGREMQMLLVLVQPHITARAVLSELDGVPAIRLLETRKTNVSNAQLFGCEIALERFREAISQHLHAGGRHMFTATAFELSSQIVLCGKRAVLSILCFDPLQHLVIELAGLTQAHHEQMGLCCIGIQAVFKRSHSPHYGA